jgi:hypothetical protein
MYRLFISAALVCCAAAVEARVGMEKQRSYEISAFLAGACQDTEHLKFLEGAYSACEAAETQWESMYKKFKEGQADPASCGGGRDLLASERTLTSMLGGYECQ